MVVSDVIFKHLMRGDTSFRRRKWHPTIFRVSYRNPKSSLYQWQKIYPRVSSFNCAKASSTMGVLFDNRLQSLFFSFLMTSQWADWHLCYKLWQSLTDFLLVISFTVLRSFTTSNSMWEYPLMDGLHLSKAQENIAMSIQVLEPHSKTETFEKTT